MKTVVSVLILALCLLTLGGCGAISQEAQPLAASPALPQTGGPYPEIERSSPAASTEMPEQIQAGSATPTMPGSATSSATRRQSTSHDEGQETNRKPPSTRQPSPGASPTPPRDPAVDFYVSPDGDDERGDGSLEKPWASISYAMRKIPDGARLLALPGIYEEAIQLERSFEEGVILQSSIPYAARLRYKGRVVTCDTCAGITIEGFDIAHLPGADQRYVIQIQDKGGDGVGGRRITLRNNIIHDSFHNDLLKINNGAERITIEGNIFYNMGGPAIDNHIDVNSARDVTIQENIFFNCFECSERERPRRSGHFIVIKDSNGERDGISGSHQIRVQKNIFLNWQGIPGGAFIGIGDGQDFRYYQGYDILIENNLMLGNSDERIHAALKIDGGKDITFRNNTISGDLPGRSYALRLDESGSGLPNVNIHLFNNIWSDPTGTMGIEASVPEINFSDTPAEVIESFLLSHNLYWNGDRPVPFEPDHLFNYTSDLLSILADPRLPVDLSQILLPFVDEESATFADGSETIRMAFERLAFTYGALDSGSPAIDAANPENAPSEDILGRPRPQGAGPDIGAWEFGP